MQKDDRIFRSTRIVSALVAPILFLAFIILYLFPAETGQRFAWEIKPHMTAMYMGAGYLGGAWFFLRTLISPRWHRVQAGFTGITAFTILMLLATILHWDRFDPAHFPFQLWLVLYAITPFLVPFLWLRNRGTDPRTPEGDDASVPAAAALSLGVLGAVLLLFAGLGFLYPDLVIRVWPWTLTPLTARVLSGWFSLLGVAGIVISQDRRWSSWRVGLQSIGLWHLLVLLAGFLAPADYVRGPVNWYTAGVAAVLLGMLVLYIQMERRRRGLVPSGLGV